jgi:hypothetical protein
MVRVPTPAAPWKKAIGIAAKLAGARIAIPMVVLGCAGEVRAGALARGSATGPPNAPVVVQHY